MGKFSDFLFGAAPTAPVEQRSVEEVPAGQPLVRSRTAPSVKSVSVGEALGLSAVFRSVQVISTGVTQLRFDAYRGDSLLNPAPTWIRQPDLNSTRRAFIEETTVSLATKGNAYWLVTRDMQNRVQNITLLDPFYVTAEWDAFGVVTGYNYRDGKTYLPTEIQHLKFLRVPGSVYGLGPIQAAQRDLRGALDTRNVAASWFTDSGTPGGLLTTTQALNADQADAYKERWIANMAEDSRLAVLGQGLEYKPLLLSPADAQWIESRGFSTTEMARLFGIPAGLLLAPVGGDGSSETYSNISQGWTELARFTLAQYAGEIADAFSSLLPRGTESRVNYEALLEADTSTRYASYAIALNPESGWMTKAEVRALEGLTALDEALANPTQGASAA
jgi:HK97 family phage portal protein